MAYHIIAFHHQFEAAASSKKRLSKMKYLARFLSSLNGMMMMMQHHDNDNNASLTQLSQVSVMPINMPNTSHQFITFQNKYESVITSLVTLSSSSFLAATTVAIPIPRLVAVWKFNDVIGVACTIHGNMTFEPSCRRCHRSNATCCTPQMNKCTDGNDSGCGAWPV